jgi:hypothetical protein
MMPIAPRSLIVALAIGTLALAGCGDSTSVTTPIGDPPSNDWPVSTYSLPPDSMAAMNPDLDPMEGWTSSQERYKGELRDVMDVLTTTVPGGIIVNRMPTLSDRNPTARRSPMDLVHPHVTDERPRWTWTPIETQGLNVFQGDFKVTDRDQAFALHGNYQQHRIQLGECGVYRTSTGWRLVIFGKHDRLGANPIFRTDIYIENRQIVRTASTQIRNSGKLNGQVIEWAKNAAAIGLSSLTGWAPSVAIAVVNRAWAFSKWALPGVFAPYQGWEKDAVYFTTQVGYYYAKALPVK